MTKTDFIQTKQNLYSDLNIFEFSGQAYFELNEILIKAQMKVFWNAVNIAMTGSISIQGAPAQQ